MHGADMWMHTYVPVRAQRPHTAATPSLTLLHLLLTEAGLPLSLELPSLVHLFSYSTQDSCLRLSSVGPLCPLRFYVGLEDQPLVPKLAEQAPYPLKPSPHP